MSFNSLKNKVLFKKYKVKKIIGEGSFSCVFKGINIINESEIAIKAEKKIQNFFYLKLKANFCRI